MLKHSQNRIKTIENRINRQVGKIQSGKSIFLFSKLNLAYLSILLLYWDIIFDMSQFFVLVKDESRYRRQGHSNTFKQFKENTIHNNNHPNNDFRRINNNIKKSWSITLPLYFGWQIVLTLEKIKDLTKHIVGPFKTYKQYMTSVVVLIVITSLLLLARHFKPTEAATFNFTQSDWSAGATTTTLLHPGDQTGVTTFSTSTNIDYSSTPGQISLEKITGSWTETTDAEFSAGTVNLTMTTGTGTAGSLILDP